MPSRLRAADVPCSRRDRIATGGRSVYSTGVGGSAEFRPVTDDNREVLNAHHRRQERPRDHRSRRHVADVYIEDGVIAAIGRNLPHTADTVIDATNRLVLPGGVDVHTHMELSFGGTFASGDFTTG